MGMFLPLKKNDAYLKVIPSKIFELAAMGKPILLGVDGETRSIIESYNAGLFFEPENKDSFIKTLNRMHLAKDRFDEFENGLKLLSNNFDRIKLANKMYDFLRSFCL